MEALTTEGGSAGHEEEADSQPGLEAVASTDELAEFCANAELLSGLPVGASQDTDGWLACRGALASLGLARGFLLELADPKLAGEPDSAHAFGLAMWTYRRARDRMTRANLVVAEALDRLLATRGFIDSLPGQLPGDGASQERLPDLMRKLRRIVALAT